MNIQRHSINAIGYAENTRRDSSRLQRVEGRFKQLYAFYTQADGDYDAFMKNAQALIAQE